MKKQNMTTKAPATSLMQPAEIKRRKEWNFFPAYNPKYCKRGVAFVMKKKKSVDRLVRVKANV